MNEECVIFSTAPDSVPTHTCARLAFCEKKKNHFQSIKILFPTRILKCAYVLREAL